MSSMADTADLSTGRHTHLDEVSKAIIEQLQQDGRRAYAKIGQAVGLSEAAVRQRVQRLIDNGVMQIVAVTAPMELGFARQAMIGLTVEGPLEPSAVRPLTLVSSAEHAEPQVLEDGEVR